MVPDPSVSLTVLFYIESYSEVQIEAEGLVLIVGRDVAAVVEIIAHAWLSVEAEQMAEVELHAQTTVYRKLQRTDGYALCIILILSRIFVM